MFLLDEIKSSISVLINQQVERFTLQEEKVLKKRQMRAPSTRVDITAMMIQVHRAAPSPDCRGRRMMDCYIKSVLHSARFESF